MDFGEHIIPVTPYRARIDAGWDDAPHLDEEQKARQLATTPPHQREARRLGIPTQGEGAIYDHPEEMIVCDPFPIPRHWKRGYAMDVGWNWTAAIWLAEDPTDLTLYIYSEHKAGKMNPIMHAAAIHARGKSLRGAVDPAANQSNQKDGEKLKMTYQSQGLKLVNAVNDVEAGLAECWVRYAEGRLKVFRSCTKTLQERKHYHRKRKQDKDGIVRSKIMKKNDHLMDCKRYAVMTWDAIKSSLTDGAVQTHAPMRVSDGSGL